MTIQSWGERYVIVDGRGLFLTRDLTWTAVFAPQALYTSWQDAWTTLTRYQQDK